MTENNFISIIIPIYNGENTLERCLNSVLKQTHTLWELLLIDNNSTDSSREWIQNWISQHPDIQAHMFVCTIPGAGSARNVGLKKASGKFVLFLDVDDWLEPKALDLLLKHLSSYPSLNFAIGSRIIHFTNTKKGNDQTEHIHIFPPKNWSTLAEYGREKHLNQYVFLNCTGTLFYRQFLEKNKLRFPEYTLVEDVPFAILTRVYPPFGFFDQIIYHYALNDNSTMHQPHILQNNPTEYLGEFLKQTLKDAQPRRKDFALSFLFFHQLHTMLRLSQTQKRKFWSSHKKNIKTTQKWFKQHHILKKNMPKSLTFMKIPIYYWLLVFYRPYGIFIIKMMFSLYHRIKKDPLL